MINKLMIATAAVMLITPQQVNAQDSVLNYRQALEHLRVELVKSICRQVFEITHFSDLEEKKVDTVILMDSEIELFNEITDKIVEMGGKAAPTAAEDAEIKHSIEEYDPDLTTITR